MNRPADTEPSPSEIETLPGPAVLEFGTSWCGWCLAAQPLISTALSTRPQVRHLKVEDGRGRPLGRSFRVKLWPTLVFLKDGQEVARSVRPASLDVISQALDLIDGPAR